MAEAPLSAGEHPAHKGGAKPGRGWLRLLLNVYKEQSDDHIGLISAGVAFYGLLAIFPGIVAVMALAGLVMDPSGIVSQLQGLSRFLPAEAAQIVIDQATAVAGSESGGLGLAAIFGILFAIYSSSKGVTSIMEGLNVAFEVPEKRGLVSFYLTALALTLGVIVGFLLIVAILAVVPAVLGLLPLGPLTEWIIRIVRWPLVMVVVGLGLAVLYRWGPSRGPVPWHWVTPGAIAATVIWVAASLAFTIYVANFGSYNETFGTLGGVIVLLTWLWLSSYIILLGAEIDSEIERQDTEEPGEPAPVAAAKAVTPGAQPGEPAPQPA